MKLYIVIWGQIITGDNSLDFDECVKKNISDIAWKDKALADEFALNKYEKMRKDIETDITDESTSFGSYSGEFIDSYADTANQIYAYVKEVEVK